MSCSIALTMTLELKPISLRVLVTSWPLNKDLSIGAKAGYKTVELSILAMACLR